MGGIVFDVLSIYVTIEFIIDIESDKYPVYKKYITWFCDYHLAHLFVSTLALQ